MTQFHIRKKNLLKEMLSSLRFTPKKISLGGKKKNLMFSWMKKRDKGNLV